MNTWCSRTKDYTYFPYLLYAKGPTGVMPVSYHSRYKTHVRSKMYDYALNTCNTCKKIIHSFPAKKRYTYFPVSASALYNGGHG